MASHTEPLDLAAADLQDDDIATVRWRPTPGALRNIVATVLVGVAIAALVWVFDRPGTANSQSVTVTAAATGAAPKVGKPAPDFELTMIDGTKARLSDFKGKPVWINFWASWCPPCRAENPDIQDLYNAHKDADGLVLLAPAIGEGRDSVAGYMQRADLQTRWARTAIRRSRRTTACWASRRISSWTATGSSARSRVGAISKKDDGEEASADHRLPVAVTRPSLPARLAPAQHPLRRASIVLNGSQSDDRWTSRRALRPAKSARCEIPSVGGCFDRHRLAVIAGTNVPCAGGVNRLESRTEPATSGSSSVGRASASQAEGRGLSPRLPLHF